jgi:hypothetical protein
MGKLTPAKSFRQLLRLAPWEQPLDSLRAHGWLRPRKERPHTAPPRHWQIDVAVGAAFLTVGAGGVLSSVVASGLATKPAWSEPWFLITVSVSGFFFLLGLYMQLAVYLELPLPEPRSVRESRAGLLIGEMTFPIEEEDSMVIEVPLHVGWADIDNASLNVVVPDVVTIERCHGDGASAYFPGGRMSHSSESLPGHEETGTNYWEQGELRLAAFTNTAWHFRLRYDPSLEEFAWSFRLYAQVLRGGILSQGGIITNKGEAAGRTPPPDGVTR